MLFNVFNQKLVHLLSTCYSGITINNEVYNVFCYADDIILARLSIAGFQQLIDTASSKLEALILTHQKRFAPYLASTI